MISPGTAAIAAGGALALALAYRRAKRRALGPLVPGQLYRVRLSCDQSWTDTIAASAPQDAEQIAVETAVGAALVDAGFTSPSSVTQDPSDWTVFVAIARATGSTVGPTRPEVHVTGVEPVSDDGVAGETATNPSDTGLDAGLTSGEAHAVRFALERDGDPTRLDGFAETFDGDFPIAASLLHAKARLELLSRQTTSVSGARSEPERVAAMGALERRGFVVRPLRPVAARAGSIFDPLGSWADPVVKPVNDVTSSVTDTVSDLWNKYGGVVETLGGWVPGPQLWLVETAVKEADAIESGQNAGSVLSAQALRFADGLRQSAPLLSYVPGLGQGVAVALTAAAILATCGLGGGCPPLDQAAIDLAASQVPGGPVTQSAFRGAAAAGYGAARGESWDQAALEGARSSLPSDEARVAFDAGLAVARGELLTEKGFQTLYHLAQGSGLLDKALDYADAILEAAQKNVDVKTSLLDRLSRFVSSSGLSPFDIKTKLPQALSAIQLDPSLLKMWPSDLAAAIDVPEPIANIALGAFQDLGNGVIVADPDVTLRFLPKMTASNAALLASSSIFAPQRAGISDPRSLLSALNQFDTGSVPGSAAAQDSLARARRALDRANWVAWYKKIEDLGMM